MARPAVTAEASERGRARANTSASTNSETPKTSTSSRPAIVDLPAPFGPARTTTEGRSPRIVAPYGRLRRGVRKKDRDTLLATITHTTNNRDAPVRLRQGRQLVDAMERQAGRRPAGRRHPELQLLGVRPPGRQPGRLRLRGAGFRGAQWVGDHAESRDPQVRCRATPSSPS
jgi:hypothetical protein